MPPAAHHADLRAPAAWRSGDGRRARVHGVARVGSRGLLLGERQYCQGGEADDQGARQAAYWVGGFKKHYTTEDAPRLPTRGGVKSRIPLTLQGIGH